MAELTIWSPEELEQRAKPKRALQREQREQMIAEYSEQFDNVGPGFGGQVVLGEEEDKRKVRALIREAAARKNLVLRFRPIKDKHRIEFRVIDPSEQKSRQGAGRRGRPKKNR